MSDDGLSLLVCGGRAYSDRNELSAALTRIHRRRGIVVVIHGGASGADALAKEWAQRHGINTIGYPADWAKHGKAAGPIRNAFMLEHAKPDAVMAFDGGRGTADMVKRAKGAGIPVWRTWDHGL